MVTSHSVSEARETIPLRTAVIWVIVTAVQHCKKVENVFKLKDPFMMKGPFFVIRWLYRFMVFVTNPFALPYCPSCPF
jgi:hypothetical protein